MKEGILHLTLYWKWFERIMNGEKFNEYRRNTPYWRKRLLGKNFKEIWFTNGYGKHRPFMRVECRGIGLTPSGYDFDIKLGDIYEIKMKGRYE